MRITTGFGLDRSTWNPIWTQETRLRTHARRLRREAPENSFRRRGGQAGPQVRHLAGRVPRSIERRPTGPSDGPHRSMLVRPSPGRGRYPPDRPRISIVHPLPARGLQTVDENSPTSITKISSASAAGSYYRRINTDSTNIRAHNDENHRRAGGSVQYDTTAAPHTAP